MDLTSLSLTLLPTADNGASNSLLSIVYGGASTGSGVNPVLALQQALNGETKGVAAAAAEPQAKREIASFRAAVAAAKTPADLLANPTARKVLLTANGLGDQAAYGALASKALLSDTTKTDSLAATLTDPRWLSTAKTYDFANQGLALLKKPGVIDKLANAYAEVQWRTGLDTSTPGLSNAIDFRSRAGTITSALQILGDSTLRTVVTTALGIPKEIAYQSLDAQAKAITDKVDITQFKNAAFVEQFTRRYLIAAGNATTSPSGTATGVASLFV